MNPSQHPAFDDHEAVHLFEDAGSGLRAIIAIHSTHLGAAAGGCRVWRYANDEAALGDALRLSQGMSYKNAMAGLPAGGGKSVILKPEGAFDRRALFEAFGRAVASLNGQYITAEDVGASVADMEVVATQTRYVVGLPPKGQKAGGDPSPWTALGVFEAMKQAIEARLNLPMDQASVAVQGLGAVGMPLAVLLHEAGVKLTVADISAEKTAQAAAMFGADVVSVDDIHKVAADVVRPLRAGRLDQSPDHRGTALPDDLRLGQQSAGHPGRGPPAARPRRDLLPRLCGQCRRHRRGDGRIRRRGRSRGQGASDGHSGPHRRDPDPQREA